MILGIDHMALNCQKLKQGEETLKLSGYQNIFTSVDLENHPEKRDFVQNFKNKHSISYFKSNFSIPIELTQHSNSGSSQSGPYVLGYCGPRNSFPKTYENNTMYEALNQYFEKVFLGIYQWNHFQAPVIHFSPTNGFSRFFCYQVNDVKLSAEFWTHLFRFRIKQSSYPHWVVLEFFSPIQSWSFEFMLVQTSETSRQSNLDDSGFTCLALLCTDLETHLLEYRQSYDLRSTCPFEITPNNKRLKITLIRGINHEPIELIEMLR